MIEPSCQQTYRVLLCPMLTTWWICWMLIEMSFLLLILTYRLLGIEDSKEYKHPKKKTNSFSRCLKAMTIRSFFRRNRISNMWWISIFLKLTTNCLRIQFARETNPKYFLCFFFIISGEESIHIIKLLNDSSHQKNRKRTNNENAPKKHGQMKIFC